MNDLAISFQVDFDLGRTNTILILGIVPYLPDGHIDYRRCVHIRQCRKSAFRLCIRQGITIRNRFLLPTVLVLRTIRVLIQSGNRCCPAILRI